MVIHPKRAPPAVSFTEVLSRFPDLAVVARGLSLSYFTVAAWSRRDYVPPVHWPALCNLATEMAVIGVSRRILRRLGEAKLIERQANRSNPLPVHAPPTR